MRRPEVPFEEAGSVETRLRFYLRECRFWIDSKSPTTQTFGGATQWSLFLRVA
jgi:hypothetical protein